MAIPGQRLAGRYELIEPVGSGGMAVVWRARDLRLDRPVAVKLLRPPLADDADVAERFALEARRAASLSHRNVASVYDTDVDGDERFIVMEFVDGPSVADLLAERGRLEPEIAVDIAAAAGRALAAAHRRGLIHRDVKPANLLVGRDGRLRLVDFGIARALTASRTTTPGTVLGSLPYLSPEQARGEEASAAGDVFSLGVVLFEMLTGELPWDAETPAAMATVRLHVPAPPPSTRVRRLPEDLDAIVARALAQDPADRYPSARVFADALGAWSRQHRRAAGASGGACSGRGSSSRVRLAAAGAAARATAGPAPAKPVSTASRGRAAGAGAAARAVGTADPNPAARRPAGRTPTGHDAARGAPLRAVIVEVPARTDPEPWPRGSRAGAGAIDPEQSRRRWGELVLAAIAFVLVGAVALAMLLGGEQEAAGPVALASPSTPVAAILPEPSVEPTDAATESAVPTEAPARTDPPATPRPVPSKPPPTEPPTPQLSAPARAVVSFYEAVVAHDWDRAIDLWSPSMQQRYPPDEWLIDRFRPTTQIDITRIGTVFVDHDAGTARVSVSLIEYRRTGPSPRTFVGSWDLVRIGGEWKLNDPNF